MSELRPRPGGLILKLALFYVLLSLPSLVLVESTILIFEFQQFMSGVEGGSLRRATVRGAKDLAARWQADGGERVDALTTWAEAWILRLERPREGLSVEDSYVLLELASDPLVAAVLAPDGRVLASAPGDARWQPELPKVTDAALLATRAADGSITLAGSDSPYRIRRVLAPVHSPDGELRGWLFVELRLPVPWRKFLLDLSFEWPIVLGYLIVFGLASSFFLATWVTRRLNRIARAANAWSRGEFGGSIGDRSRDELGHLSRLLDGMALDLKDVMRSRTELATLAERQRLARDLHDTVKQKAFALNLQLATARRTLGESPVAGRIELAQRLTQQIQQELAQILDELRAPEAELPFHERLRLRALEWSHASGVTPSFAIADVSPVPAEVAQSLLRIADEALANVMRHSSANAVAIVLRREADRIVLAIDDNGRGIAAETASGTGLGNMRSRALSLPSGTFELESRPGGGTRVTVGTLAPGTVRS